MQGPRSRKTQASEHAVFSALADVLNSWETPGVRLWGVKVSVEASRFGYDQAFSVRMRSETREEEIGKILVIPLGQEAYEFKIPKNHTGGAKFPDLDADGTLFDAVIGRVLEALVQRGLIALPAKRKPPLGFRPKNQPNAS